MSGIRRNRLPLFAVSSAVLLGSIAWAGVFPRETAESIGLVVKQSNGQIDVVFATVVGRTYQANQDPGHRDSFVTILDIQGWSLASQATVSTRVAYLGATWNPSLFYGTSAEPPAPMTDLGQRAVFVLERSAHNAPWLLGGMNRIAPVVRNASGQDIAVSQSPGFFVEANQPIPALQGRIRKAAGWK